MSNINLQSVFNSALGQFKVEGAGSSRFKDNFVTAVNRTTKKLNREANLASAINAVNVVSTTLIMDDKYEDVLNLGIIYNLIQLGQRPAKSLEITARKAREDFEDAIGMVYTDIINDNQEDADNDVIGLGSLSS